MTDNNPKMVFNQKVRDAMRKHGLTEIFEGIYSAGQTKGNSMAVVRVIVKMGASDAEIQQAADKAAAEYLKSVGEGQ